MSKEMKRLDWNVTRLSGCQHEVIKVQHRSRWISTCNLEAYSIRTEGDLGRELKSMFNQDKRGP